VPEIPADPVAWPPCADDLRRILGSAPRLVVQRGENGSIQVAGVLPGGDWKKLVHEALQAVSPEDRIESSELKSGLLVTDAGFTQMQPLDELLRGVFGVPGSASLLAEGSGALSLKAAATEELAAQWLALLNRLQGREANPAAPAPVADLRLYPSIYHMPGYRCVSQLPESTVQDVQVALRGAPINFDAGSADIGSTEVGKLHRVLELMKDTGPAAHYVIGGSFEPTGNPEANRRLSGLRSQAVLAWLTARGLPAEQAEILTFGATEAANTASTEETRAMNRRVSILLK
jgi:outer membrane protein OmpA-like peptidoglycan-associated protein